MKEKWIRINTIEGYEDVKGQYWISNSDEDKIINRSTGKQLKVQINKRGYKRIGLTTIEGKHKICKIHTIKAKAFLYGPNPLNYNIVRHLDDYKAHNRLENLTWGTVSQNIKDSIRNGNFNYKVAIKNLAGGDTIITKKLSKPVKCLDTGITYISISEASRQLNIPITSISNCCRGRCKTAGGLHWEFIQKENEN